MRELRTWRHPDGNSLLAWCPDCKRYHWHGAGGSFTDDSFGHRAAHCHPSVDGGYMLIDQGPATESILQDLKRRKPLGPDETQTSAGDKR